MPPEPRPRRLAASELVEQIRAQGGRIHSTREAPRVFVLTDSQELADWLVKLGGRPHTASGVDTRNGYLRARGGTREWDIWVHQIPVSDEQTTWEAARA